MTIPPYKVFVIVDRGFGERLTALAKGFPVWIVNTPTNAPVVQRLRKERRVGNQPSANHLTGITTFQDSDSALPEDLLVDNLDTIDLHHGPYSANPPYTQLEVLGTLLTDRVKSELSEYGFNDFAVSPGGFRCSRPLPAKQS